MVEMRIKVPKDWKSVLKPDCYIKTVVLIELLCNIVWINPISMQLKIFLLLYGLVVLFVNFKAVTSRVGKITVLLLVAAFSSLFSAFVYWDSYGIKGTQFFIFDILVFLIVFHYVLYQDAEDSHLLFHDIIDKFLPISLVLACIGVVYFINGEAFEFYPKQFFLARVLGGLGINMPDEYVVSYIYGYAGGYLYGCLSTPGALGTIAFFSMVFSFYRLSERERGVEKRYTDVFDRVNIIFQILNITFCGMRASLLGCAFFLGICAVKKVKVHFSGYMGNAAILVMVAIFALAAVIGISFLNKSRDSFVGRQGRNIDSQVQRIESQMDDVGISLSLEAGAVAEPEKLALSAYRFVTGNEILRRIDSLSTTRFRIWVSAFFDIANRGFLVGRPSNTVKGVREGEITERDFHSAYVRTLSIYGFFGGAFLLCVFGMLLLKCFHIIQKRDKRNSFFYLAAGIIAQFVIELTGGGLSASLDMQVIIFWILSALIMGRKERTGAACLENR